MRSRIRNHYKRQLPVEWTDDRQTYLAFFTYADDRFSVVIPDIPEVVASGETLLEATINIRHRMEEYIGKTGKAPTHQRDYITLSADPQYLRGTWIKVCPNYVKGRRLTD